MRPLPKAAPAQTLSQRMEGLLGLARQLPETFRLVWQAGPRSALSIGALTLVSALFPAAIAYVGKLIIDAVVAAARSGSAEDRLRVASFVGLELGLMLA